MFIARSAIPSLTRPLRSSLFTQARPVVKIGSSLSSTFSTSAPVNMSGAKQLVQQEIKDNFVMVFSKSYCPVSRKRKAHSFHPTDQAIFRICSTAQPLRNSSPNSKRTSRTERPTRLSSKSTVTPVLLDAISLTRVSLSGWTNETTDPTSRTTSPRNTDSEPFLRSLSTRYVVRLRSESVDN